MKYMSKDMFVEIYGDFNYASIDATGSVRGMKKLGFWGKKDTCIRCGKYIYNVDRRVVTYVNHFERNEYKHLGKGL